MDGTITEMTDREFAIDVVRRLREAGFEAFWAGGCVRDELFGIQPGDYDVATNSKPDQVRAIFRRSIEVGASFGVIEVIGPKLGNKHLKCQVATFRTDVSYSDGRRPDAVTFCTAQEDALRRDFTINGMFYDPLEEKLIDYVGGQADLQARILRAIGDPRARFTEDKLRLMRAVRFAARFRMQIEPETAAAIREMADQITVVSAERIADELRRLLGDPQRVRGLQLLSETGVMAAILPEVSRMHGVPQGLPSAPNGDLWEHTLDVVGRLPADANYLLAFAALLHDVGKPATMGRTPDRYTFHGHEHHGRVIAETIATRLRFANAERACIAWLVEKHQYLADAPVMRPSKLKAVLAAPHIRELLELHRADALASGKGLDHVEFAHRKLQEWTDNGELAPVPLLTGDDLKQLGLEPGPAFKSYLDAVREAQLDGTITSRDEACALIDQLRSKER